MAERTDILVKLAKILLENKDNDRKLADIAALVECERRPPTPLAGLFERYAGARSFAPNTVKAYSNKYGQFARYAARRGLVSAEDVTEDTAAAYAAWLFGRKRSAGYDVFVLKSVWAGAAPALANPWKSVKRTAAPAAVPAYTSHRPLTAAEIRRLTAAADREISARSASAGGVPAAAYAELKDAMVFAETYGMRISSCMSLRNGDFRQWRRRGFFLHVPPKTARRKPVPLDLPVTDGIAEILTRRRGRDAAGWLFPELRSRFERDGSYVAHMFRRLAKAAGVRSSDLGKASFHSFRATFVTRMDEVGAPKGVTDRITGHAPNEMHNVYSRPGVRIKRRWILKALARRGK